jgi:hypothetical protein
MAPTQVDSNGDPFIVNEMYDMVDRSLPQGDPFLTMRVQYLGYGITQATTNPNFVGNGLGNMYNHRFVFQLVNKPESIKIPINPNKDENGEIIFIRHYPGSPHGGRKSRRKSRRSRKRPTRRFRI